MAIQGGTLRFFQGMAELFGSADLIGRLTGMVEDLEAKAEEAAANVEQAAAKAAQAWAAGLREGVLAVLEARGIPCPDDVRERLISSDDPATLQRWLSRAKVVRYPEQIFSLEPEAPWRQPAKSPPPAA